MKNIETIKKLEAFILYVILHQDKYIIPKVSFTNLLQFFKPIPEKGAEIFLRPDITYHRMSGDCDDWTTLISFIAKRKGIKYKHVYKLNKDNAAIHIYPILFIKGAWVTLDPWQSREAFKYKKLDDEKEIETCLMIGGICQTF